MNECLGDENEMFFINKWIIFYLNELSCVGIVEYVNFYICKYIFLYICVLIVYLILIY